MNILKKIANKIRMATMIVNNVSHVGNSIVITNGRVIIDGKEVTPENEKIIDIKIEGNVRDVNVGYCRSLSVNGNVETLGSTSGDVTVNGYAKSINSTSGDIQVGGNVEGNVGTTSGDVEIRGSVGGNVKTLSGDISHR
jgi:hypothetical protein